MTDYERLLELVCVCIVALIVTLPVFTRVAGSQGALAHKMSSCKVGARRLISKGLQFLPSR